MNLIGKLLEVFKLRVTYRNKKIEAICNNASKAEKYYGINVACKIQIRIDQIASASTVDELLRFRIGRCHALLGNRKNQYAMDLVQPLRLIFIVDKTGQIQIAEIIEIVDYH